MAIGGVLLAPRVLAAVGHGIGHAVAAAPFTLVVVAALRWWPPPRRAPPGRVARVIAVLGLSGFVLGQLLEIIGWRVDEPNATGAEELAHTAGQVVTNLSLPIAVVGGVLALIAATRERALPRWVATVAAVAVLAMLL
ncbi:MAG: hypothetical protein ACR2KP_00350, partial [Egibacteraceae bacterium]